MSLYAYRWREKFLRDVDSDPDWEGMIMVLCGKASPENLVMLHAMAPDVVEEFCVRYHMPGGLLTVDEYRAWHKERNPDKEPLAEQISDFEDRLRRAERMAKDAAAVNGMPWEGEWS